VPQTGKREDRNRVPRAVVGFLNAYLLTGDDKYLDVWRRQNDVINAQKKTVDGKVQTPRMYGPKGWYGYAPGEYRLNGLEIWYMSQKASDRARAAEHPWLNYLDGKDAGFPTKTLRGDLERVRARAQAQRDDQDHPRHPLGRRRPGHQSGQRHSPDPPDGGRHPDRSPAVVGHLAIAGRGAALHPPALVRSRAPPGGHPAGRRGPGREAGRGRDVVVTLVNTNQVATRTMTVQGGAYAEHQILSATIGEGAATFRSIPRHSRCGSPPAPARG
jgi:hypothetical protein